MRGKFKVLESIDQEWNNIIQQTEQYDCYHLREYQQLQPQGRAVLCVFTIKDVLIALPLVIRKIPYTSSYDATSVYGYPGPLSNLSPQEIPLAYRNAFHLHLQTYLKNEKIITVFSRLHPLTETRKLLSGLGSVAPLNKTVYIDIEQPGENQRADYRKSNKNLINKLRKSDLEVVEAISKRAIHEFIAVYEETMKRVGATNNYFFTPHYFYELLQESNAFSAKLWLVKKEGKVIAGSIFIIANGLMQYHLSGTKTAFLKDKPMSLLIDEARLWANQQKLKAFHLGGGTSALEEDSLFRFKKGFSKEQARFKVWKFVVDAAQYQALNNYFGADPEEPFFPAYRAKPLQPKPVLQKQKALLSA